MKKSDKNIIKKIIELIVNANRSKTVNSLNIQQANHEQESKLNELLNKNIKLEDIPNIFLLLFNSDKKVVQQVAEVLNHVVSELDSTQLVRLDKLFRERQSINWDYDWRNKKPEDLLIKSMTQDQKLTIIGLCSFLPNGYFREKAIKSLSKMKNGHEIPFILIRINDWVNQVRNTSKDILDKYLIPEYAMSLVDNLPLVLRLNECLRDEYRDVVDKVTSIITSSRCSEKLISGLKSNDSKVRLACYKIIIKRKILDNSNIINHLLQDKNSYNRISVLREIQKSMDANEIMVISQLLLNDKFYQIRIFAIEKLYSVIPDKVTDVLEKCLFDKNRSVRETSRYLLSKSKEYDFVAMYRDLIQKNENLYAAICGLGETGTIIDSNIIYKYMSSEIICISKASINALARLNIQQYKNEIILLLNDDRPGVSKAAMRALHKAIDDSDADIIYKIHRETIYDHVKVNSCVLLCSLSKWNAIKYIIEFCVDKNITISIIGQNALEGWKQKYNKSFVKPSSSQTDEIMKTLKYFGKLINGSDRAFIESALKNFGI